MIFGPGCRALTEDFVILSAFSQRVAPGNLQGMTLGQFSGLGEGNDRGKLEHPTQFEGA